MDDRVGSKIPTSAEVTKLVKEIQAIGAKLLACTINLTPEERRRTLKFRPGGERVVQLIGALATEHELNLPTISVAAMNRDLELYQQLQPVAAALGVLSQTIADTILEAQSECWWAMTAYYTTLSRLADADPRIVGALRPAVEFFALGKRAAKPAPPAATDPAAGGGAPTT